MFNKPILEQFLSSFERERQSVLLKAYVESFEKHIKISEEALTKEDSKTLLMEVHDLKSLSLIVGDLETGALAGSIESNLKNQNIQLAYNDIPALFEAIKSILKIMREYEHVTL